MTTVDQTNSLSDQLMRNVARVFNRYPDLHAFTLSNSHQGGGYTLEVERLDFDDEPGEPVEGRMAPREYIYKTIASELFYSLFMIKKLGDSSLLDREYTLMEPGITKYCPRAAAAQARDYLRRLHQSQRPPTSRPHP